MTNTFTCQQCENITTLHEGLTLRFCPSCGSKKGKDSPPEPTGRGRLRVKPLRETRDATEVQCPKCGFMSQSEATYCWSCGSHFREPTFPMTTIGEAEYLGGGDFRFGYKADLKFSADCATYGEDQIALMTDVVCIEIVGDQAAKSKVLPVVAFGVLGGLAAKGSVDRTEIGIHMKSGAVPYFRILKQNRTKARAQLVPILHEANVPFLDEVMAEPQQLAPSPMDEIQKAFELVKAGALTQQEFDDVKKRLLGDSE